MSDDRLRRFLDALKSGKSVSFNFSEDYNGYIESNHYLISFDAVVEKYHIETKNVVDGGYPDVEISLDNFGLSCDEFELWFEKWADKAEMMKID